MERDFFGSPLGQRNLYSDVWIRDDDLTKPNPEIEALLSICGDYQIPTFLAIIPEKMDSDLLRLCRNYPFVKVWMHGIGHENKASLGRKKSEFPFWNATQQNLILYNKKRMEDLFEDYFQPIFVPPWNRLDPSWVAFILKNFDYISSFGSSDSPYFKNTNLDIVDWKLRQLKDERAIQKEMLDIWKPIGLLTHHWMHDIQDKIWLKSILNEFFVFKKSL